MDLKPQTKEEFWNVAKHPMFPDEMQFNMTNENPDNPYSISNEAISDVLDELHTFVLARILAQWERKDRPPKKMTLRVTVDWTEDDKEPDIPWFSGFSEDIGLNLIDSSFRIPERLKNAVLDSKTEKVDLGRPDSSGD